MFKSLFLTLSDEGAKQNKLKQQNKIEMKQDKKILKSILKNSKNYDEQHQQGHEKQKKLKLNIEAESLNNDDYDEYDIFREGEQETEPKPQIFTKEEESEFLQQMDQQIKLQRQNQITQRKQLITHQQINANQDQPEIDILATHERKWNKSKDSNLNNVQYKTGKFSDEELKLVFNSLLSYAQDKQLTEEELMQICTDKSKKEFHKAWNQIAKCLPNRTLQSIHNLVHRKFNPLNHQGEWTAEEQQQLIELVNEHGRRWKNIGKIMKRTALNVRDKYKEMGEENNELRDHSGWVIGEVLALILYIQKFQKHKFLKANWEDTLQNRLGEQWATIQVKEKIFKFRPGKRRSYVTCEQDQETLQCFQIILNKEMFDKLDQRGIPWTQIAQKIKSKSKDDLRNFWFTTLTLWFLSASFYVPSLKEEDQLIRDICSQFVDHDDQIDFSSVLINTQLPDSQKKQMWHFIKKRISIRKHLSDSEIIKILREQQKKNSSFEINLTFQTQNTISTSISQNQNIDFNKKNLFQDLLMQYQMVQGDNQPNFEEI